MIRILLLVTFQIQRNPVKTDQICFYCYNGEKKKKRKLAAISLKSVE